MNLMSVPLVDLRAQYLHLKEEIDSAIQRVLDKGDYVMGEEVRKFEEEWAEYCGAKYCVGVGSGTEGIYLTFRALGELMGVKGEVITTPFTFYATSQALIQAGFFPKFRDVSPSTANLLVNTYLQGPSLTVNMYGRPGVWGGCNHIEDLSHAHEALLQGRAAIFSFYPTKNLGAMGQAGAVVTNDADMANLIKKLRTYGESSRFVYDRVSGNHRMDELQAAILRVKLPHLKEWNERRREIAGEYIEGIKEINKGLSFPIIYQSQDPYHTYHIFAIKTPLRDILGDYLSTWNIQTSVRYPVPLHLQPSLAYLGYKEGDFPEAEKWAKENLSLPIYPEMINLQVEYVLEKIKSFFKSTEVDL